MALDIAFALGVLALVSSALAPGVRVMLLIWLRRKATRGETRTRSGLHHGCAHGIRGVLLPAPGLQSQLRAPTSHMLLPSVAATSGSVTFFEGWEFTGSFTLSTSSPRSSISPPRRMLNVALVARRPDHYKNFTVVGILGMALLGGLGGGITGDVLLGDVPSALTNPAYIALALGFGLLGYSVAFAKGQLFREGVFQFPGVLLASLVCDRRGAEGRRGGDRDPGMPASRRRRTDCGRWYIDVSSGVTPRQFLRGEWFVTIAAFTGDPRLLGQRKHLGVAAGVAFVLGCAVCVVALWYAWEGPLASEPTGVYRHDGRPMFGRKLKGKSRRELRDLGLLVEDGESPVVIGAEKGAARDG